MKTCDNADESVRQIPADLARRNIGDFRFGVQAVGENSGLCARERDCLAAHRVKSHRREGDRCLLAGREKDVKFAFGGMGCQLSGEVYQVVGNA